MSQSRRDKTKIQRRHFLRGLGLLLPIPFLPSIEPRSANAAPSDGRRFITFATDHGAIWGENMHPAQATLTQSQSYAGHTIRRGDLSLSVNGGTASLSPVLSASSGAFTAALASKMNVLRGLDVPWYIGHHTGGHLGNWARNDGNGTDGQIMHASPRRTIDQIMAYAPEVYGTTPQARVMVCGGGGLSYNYANPETQEGDIEEQATEESSLALFNRIYVPPTDPAEVRPPVADRVLEDYNRLRQSNRRLSAQDRLRLDAHMQKLDELDKKLKAVVTCGEQSAPGNSTDLLGGDFGHNIEKQVAYWQLFNDVFAIAFACDTSRIAVCHANFAFTDYEGNWHDDIAHRAHQVDPRVPLPDLLAQPITAAAHRVFFEGVFLDLIAKLDAIDDVDGTMLDKSLVVWTQESGPYTHDAQDMPVVMAGGASGAIQTGQHIDYRNMQKVLNGGGYEGSVEITRPGLLWYQYLGSVLQTMGISPSVYEETSHGGYGPDFYGEGDSTDSWPESVRQAQSDFLPFLKKG